VRVSVAGRVMLLRHQGKLAFAQLRDSSGSIQLFALAAVTADFDGLTKLSLGDWIGATGEVVKTRTGELSVRVSEWVLLAETRRGFGDKWHGVADVDTRYRQRYVDLWANESSRAAFQLRSRLVSLTRRWLDERDFVEVETPVFHHPRRRRQPNRSRPITMPWAPTCICASPRAVPEAPGGRGFRAGLRDRPGLPQRGALPSPQPEFTMLELYAPTGITPT